MSEEPIPFAKIRRSVRQREPLTEPLVSSLQHTMFLTGREPVPEVREFQEVQPAVRTTDERTFRVDLDIPRT